MEDLFTEDDKEEAKVEVESQSHSILDLDSIAGSSQGFQDPKSAKYCPPSPEDAMAVGAMELELNKANTQLYHTRRQLRLAEENLKLSEERLSNEQKGRRADTLYHVRQNGHLEEYIRVLRSHHDDMAKLKGDL